MTQATIAKSTSPITTRAGRPTPMTARVLAQTGGWSATIREEYDWLMEDKARARAATRPDRVNQAER